MKIEQYVIGMIGTNCYVVSNEETKECFLVDPAVCPEWLVAKIRDQGLQLKAILLTHGHFDHIMGIDGFLDAFPVPVYVHEKEQLLLNDAEYNCSANYGKGYTFSKAVSVQDGDILEIAGMKIRVIYTPGHTIGGCCYYLKRSMCCSVAIHCSAHLWDVRICLRGAHPGCFGLSGKN